MSYFNKILILCSYFPIDLIIIFIILTSTRFYLSFTPQHQVIVLLLSNCNNPQYDLLFLVLPTFCTKIFNYTSNLLLDHWLRHANLKSESGMDCHIYLPKWDDRRSAKNILVSSRPIYRLLKVIYLDNLQHASPINSSNSTVTVNPTEYKMNRESFTYLVLSRRPTGRYQN
jgi:hypothetical protein